MFVRALVRPLLRPFRRKNDEMVEKELDKRARTLLHLLPMTETAKEDVFIVGYPKSGITWFQNLIAGMMYGVDPELAPDTLIQELVPDIHQKSYYKRFQTPMFFKSHHLPRPDYKRVVYLLRDGRDAMVSFFHFNQALYGDKVDFLNMVTRGEYLIPCKWHEHVEQWLSNPYAAEMIIIKYEDLQQKPMEELIKFCKFVGVSRSDEFLGEVIQKCSFSVMRKKEKKFGWDNPIWPKDKSFVRRGASGSYKDEMPPHVLEAFLQEAAQTLQTCGYE